MASKFVYHNALFFQNIVGLNFLKSVNSFFTCVHEDRRAWCFTQDVCALGVAATLASHAELTIFPLQFLKKFLWTQRPLLLRHVLRSAGKPSGPGFPVGKTS